jgi:hypothetical protein
MAGVRAPGGYWLEQPALQARKKGATMTATNQSTPDEDVMIDFSPEAQETVDVSMDALRADGYEPPPDDDSTVVA